MRTIFTLLMLCGAIPFASPFQSTIPIQKRGRMSRALNVATQDVATSLNEELKKSYQEGMMGGKVGNWEELHGNWVLRPPSTQETPRALLHFLGGAIVGASPHITYRYMLERLAEEGFLIVATPYQLSFDHLQTCDDIITRFELMAPAIARQYGAVPVVGIGHSCGALLHLLITCLFPDTPRAANALISFNNKPVQEAVPFFEEVFTPFFTSLVNPGSNGTLPTGNELLVVGLELAKAATKGEKTES
jgi:acetyl esterase/lipase